MKKKARKPRIQRTFGYTSVGVKLHAFKTPSAAGAARFGADPGLIERNHVEFGMVGDPVLANNVEELEKYSSELLAKNLSVNYILMIGNNTVSMTNELKKAIHHFKKHSG